jgi:hypothetical protein
MISSSTPVRVASGFRDRLPKLVFGEYHTWYSVNYSAGSWSWAQGWNHWEVDEGGKLHNPNVILSNGRRDIASAFYPIVGPYDSCDETVIDYHIRLAKASGIDVFLVDWYSARQQLSPRLAKWIVWIDLCFQKLLHASERENFTLVLEYEPSIEFTIPHATRREALGAIEEDVAYIFQNYVDRKSYLRVSGEPVIFFYGEQTLSPAEWQHIFNDLRSKGMDAVYVGASGNPAYYSAFNGLYEWVALDAIAKRNSTADRRLDEVTRTLRQASVNSSDRFFAAGVWPGFNDSGVSGWGEGSRFYDRQNGSVYNNTWAAALKWKSPWVIIMTFNDWNEGTMIEPSLEFGNKYLYATAYYSARLRNRQANYDGIPAPLMIYNATQTIALAEKQGRTMGLEQAQEKLLQAMNAFESEQYWNSIALAEQALDLAAKAKPATTSIWNQPSTPAVLTSTFLILVAGATVAVTALIVFRSARKKKTTRP